jgi:hypothetical protein
MMPLIRWGSYRGSMESQLIKELRYEMGNTTGR